MYRFDNYRFGDAGGGNDVSLAAIQKQQDELKYLSNSNTSRQDFTFRSLAGVTVYNARTGYSWYRENGRLSLNLALDNLSDKFYTEPFQYTAARGRSLSVGFTVESFNLLKLFK